MQGEKGAIIRTFILAQRYAKLRFFFRTDASAIGMGGTLCNAQGNPWQYWADKIREEDEKILGAVKGDPAWMCERELLTTESVQ